MRIASHKVLSGAALLLAGAFMLCLLLANAWESPQRAYADDTALASGRLAAQAGTDDFHAVLHDDGALVFQAEAPSASDSSVRAVYAGSLEGYASKRAVPWLQDVEQIKTARFADSFAALRPQSLKLWFAGCENLEYVDLRNLDASQSTSMQKMFEDCSALARIDGLEGFDTSSSTYFGSMFSGCSSLKSLDVSGFDASHVQVLCFMFNGCSSLQTLNMAGPGWKTSSLTLMVHVWEGCSSLKSLDLSYLDTSHVRSMTYDFNGCSSLEYLDLSGADTTGIGNLEHLFDGCSKLSTVKLGSAFSFRGSSKTAQCTLPEGNWKSSATGMVHAHDEVPEGIAATYVKVAAQGDGSTGGQVDTGETESESRSGTSDAGSGGAKPTAPAKPASGMAVGKTVKVGGSTYKVTDNERPAVTFAKAPKAQSRVVVPASVLIKGKRYAVKGISPRAFKGSAAKTVVVKTKGLTKNSVKSCFKGAAKLKTVKVHASKLRAYRAIFKKGNSGKTVSVKRR